MRPYLFALAAGIAFGFSGCAVHPLPENVTGLNTYYIVDKIRCEAKQALQNKIIALLKSDPSTLEIGQRLETKDLTFAQLARLPKLDKVAATYLAKYLNAAIAYNFTFNITENNNYSGGLGFTKIFSGGNDGLALSAQNNYGRQNVRNFILADTFGKLVVDEYTCPYSYGEVNYIYPITGTIGLAELIGTFIDLNEFEHLSHEKDKVPTLSDTLTFTTLISGTANPTVLLSGATHVFRVANASFSTTQSRLDNHQVIVTLSLPVTKQTAATPLFFLTKRPAGGRPTAESNALEENSLQKSYDILGRGLRGGSAL